MKINKKEKLKQLLSEGEKAYFQKKYRKAVDCIKKYIDEEPDSVVPYFNLGVCFYEMKKYDDSEKYFHYVLEKNPLHAGAYSYQGMISSSRKQYETGVTYYRKAIECNNELSNAHFNLGMLLLKLGQFKEGWKECEWRWKTERFTPLIVPHPKWNGEKMKNSTLLVHSEQGDGDAIQFIRFIETALTRCQRVLLICVKRLKPFFAESLNLDNIDILTNEEPIKNSSFQSYIPLMSLSHIFDIDSESMPSTNRYLQSNREKYIRYKNEYFNNDCLKVGIAWKGSSTHVRDRSRSIALTTFLKLFKWNSNCKIYSLQKELAIEEKKILLQNDIIDLCSSDRDYSDAAAKLDNLNLVISVDTSMAHLGGALGLKTWILLGENSDWRWGTEGEKSYWYDSVELFRRNDELSWNLLFEVINEKLSDFSKNKRNGNSIKKSTFQQINRTENVIKVPISIGELVDKSTILLIKSIKVKDQKKLINIKYEKQLLKELIKSNIILDEIFFTIYKTLYRINAILWKVEDELRLLEKNRCFNEEFISTARQVYKLNDRRFSIKSEINKKYNSNIFEEKSYTKDDE